MLLESLVWRQTTQRTGTFTSGIVSTREGQRIALFFTGRKQAGENLSRVLERRAAEIGPPIQMCDALSRNLPRSLAVIVAHCLAHGRRRFVDVASNFPDKCRYVLETLGEVYANDALARQQGMRPDERLRFHQAQSGPVMERLHAWLTAQFAADLFRRGVPFEQVERALLLGLTRKYVSSLNSTASAGIQRLHYFLPLLEEVALRGLISGGNPQRFHRINSTSQDVIMIRPRPSSSKPLLCIRPEAVFLLGLTLWITLN
ncbi:MAG: transposase [Acidobacteriota bacterium]